MSYKCNLCSTAVPPGTPRRVHQVYRPDGSIAQELAVCADCATRLARTGPDPQAELDKLTRKYRRPLPSFIRPPVKVRVITRVIAPRR